MKPLKDVPKGRRKAEDQKSLESLELGIGVMVKTLIKALTLIERNAHSLSDDYKNMYHTCILNIVAKSINQEILTHILDSVKRWRQDATVSKILPFFTKSYFGICVVRILLYK